MGKKLTFKRKSSIWLPFLVPGKRGNTAGGHFGTADQLCKNGAFGMIPGECFPVIIPKASLISCASALALSPLAAPAWEAQAGAARGESQC